MHSRFLLPFAVASAVLLSGIVPSTRAQDPGEEIAFWTVVDSGDIPPTVISDITPAREDIPTSDPSTDLTFRSRSASAGNSSATLYSPEHVTAELQSLANSLAETPGPEADWQKLFHYVLRLPYEHYYGCKRGAHLTYLNGSGNDADLSSLLVALLRARGHEANYGMGVVVLPKSAPSGQPSMAEWLGEPQHLLSKFSEDRGFHGVYAIPGDSSKLGLKRVWVKLRVANEWIDLDPAIKRRVETTSPLNVLAASGYNRSTFFSTVGGTLTGPVFDGMAPTTFDTYLLDRAKAMRSWISENLPEEPRIFGALKFEPYASAQGILRFPGSIWESADVPHERLTGLPDNHLSKLSLKVQTTAATPVVRAETQIPMSALGGRRLSLEFSNNTTTGRAQIWLDDSILVEETASASGTLVGLNATISHPWGSNLNFVNPQRETKHYKRGKRYVLLYDFKPSPLHISTRQARLDAYLEEGKSASSREVVAESLNIVGLSWGQQCDLVTAAVSRISGLDDFIHNRFGRVGQEASPYIDVGLILGAALPHESWSRFRTHFAVSAMFHSGLEHGVLEQWQGANKPGVSTVKAWRLGVQQPAASRKMFYVTDNSTWQSVKPQLTGYSASELANFQSYVIKGLTIVLPQKGNLALKSWRGSGYMLSSSLTRGMIISGGLSGGYTTVAAQVDPEPILQIANSAPLRIDSNPPLHAPVWGIDPIDLLTGDYVLEKEDLSIGTQEAPWGLSFTRYHHGSRRKINAAGLGKGWTHNWHVQGTLRAAHEQAFGINGKPVDAATMLVAIAIAYDLCSAPEDARTLTLAGLTACWGVDQLLDNSFAITMGNQSLQFMKRPDGTWEAPPGVTSTLVSDGTGWLLTERNGRTFSFDSKKRLRSISDPVSPLWNKQLTLTYDTASRVAKVTDIYGDTLTFTYSNGNLAKVVDQTRREVRFAYDADKNLTAITDPEGQTERFEYDTDNRVTVIRNASDQVVAQNIYGADGRVKEQLAHGTANRTWKYFFGPQHAVEQDPLGGRKTFLFDDRRRTVATIDEMGRRTDSVFDIHDRKVWQGYPSGAYEWWYFDEAHNLRQHRNTDGYITTYDYDSLHRLTTVTDPLGRSESKTYNARHQVLTASNSANETTSFEYDSLGRLSASVAPGQVRTEFSYNATSRNVPFEAKIPNANQNIQTTLDEVGNVILLSEATVGNNFMRSYNKRRQLLGEDSDLEIAKYSYDPNGNVVGELRTPRGGTTTYTYSPTGKLLTTTLPAIGGQPAAIIENKYDVRDWLEKTIDPTGRSITYGLNAAGQIVTETNSLNQTITHEYDEDGRKRATLNGLNQPTKWVRDGRGNPTLTVDALNQSTSMGYDGAGRLVSTTNRRGETTAFTYDAAGRQITLRTPMGRTFETTYNSRGLVATTKEPSGQTTTYASHNSLGLPLTRTDADGSIAMTYDSLGRISALTENGATLSLSRSGWYSAAYYYTNPDGVHLSCIRRKFNGSYKVVSIKYGGSFKEIYHSYDARGRLTSISDWTGRVTSFTYDAAGRLLTLTRPNGTRRTQTYDLAGRLATVQDVRVSDGTSIVSLEMRYDAAGRLWAKRQLPAWPAVPAPTPRSATADADNRLEVVGGTAVSHDADGNVLSAPSALGTGVQSYTWNGRNQLLGSSAGATRTYDALGNRISMTANGTTTNYVVDPVGGSMPRVLWSQRGSEERVFYVYAGDTLLYQFTETGNVAHYYHYDHIGSTVALSDAGASVTDRFAYSTYGREIGRTGTTPTPFRFCGAHGVSTDPDGLVHMRARYYNPVLGRFISEDPIQFEGGANWYAYAEGNPAMAVDPAGTTPFLITGGIGAFVGGVSGGIYAAFSGGDVLASMGGGAVGGFVVGSGAGIIGAAVGAGTISTAGALGAGAVVGASGGVVGNTMEQRFQGRDWAEISMREQMIAGGAGAVGGFAGSGATVINQFAVRNSIAVNSTLQSNLKNYSSMLITEGASDAAVLQVQRSIMGGMARTGASTAVFSTGVSAAENLVFPLGEKALESAATRWFPSSPSIRNSGRQKK